MDPRRRRGRRGRPGRLRVRRTPRCCWWTSRDRRLDRIRAGSRQPSAAGRVLGVGFAAGTAVGRHGGGRHPKSNAQRRAQGQCSCDELRTHRPSRTTAPVSREPRRLLGGVDGHDFIVRMRAAPTGYRARAGGTINVSQRQAACFATLTSSILSERTLRVLMRVARVNQGEFSWKTTLTGWSAPSMAWFGGVGHPKTLAASRASGARSLLDRAFLEFLKRAGKVRALKDPAGLDGDLPQRLVRGSQLRSRPLLARP